MTPEKQIQSKIMAHLAKLKDEGHPLFYERRQAGGFAYKAGLSDIYFVYNGLHVEVEVKRPGGSMSAIQETWARKFKELKVVHICVDNVEEFKKFMSYIIQRLKTFNVYDLIFLKSQEMKK